DLVLKIGELINQVKGLKLDPDPGQDAKPDPPSQRFRGIDRTPGQEYDWRSETGKKFSDIEKEPKPESVPDPVEDEKKNNHE
ncbi:unnamed protein product, partial [marine sediment metagenome]